MKSMTGYGKGSATEGGHEVTIELRSVNNRFLEVNTRIPKSLLACDELIRALAQKHLARGSVDVFFTYKSAVSEGSLTADLQQIAAYKSLADDLKSQLGIENDLSFMTLLARGLIEREESSQNPEIVLELARKATLEALENLNAMRKIEGAGIKSDLLRLAESIEVYAKKAEERAPNVVSEYRKKLRERIDEYLGEVAIDEARIINEVAFFGDKADINEEISRLNSHLSQFRVGIEGIESAGRKLDFIAQEIGREINTLGSKSNDITLTGYVVEMKNLLEKIKEQIRNVE